MLVNLITAYVEARRVHSDAIARTDAAAPGNWDAAFAEQAAAVEVLDATLTAVCAYRPLDDMERSWRSDFLRNLFFTTRIEITPEQIAALIDTCPTGATL